MTREAFDDTAFYFFGAAALGSILIPWTLSKLVVLVWAVVFSDADDGAETVTLFDGPSKVKSEKKASKRLFSRTNLIFVVLWALFIAILVQSEGYMGEEVERFDPYVVLGLDPSGYHDMAAIKKAYKRKSLETHPDRNPGVEDAQEVFIQVSKAYKTLTDPAARDNYAKYGNPDGPQATSSTIGLPTFLLDPSNQYYVLALYILAFVIVLPFFVNKWWSKAKDYDPEGVAIQSIRYFYTYINNAMMAPKFLIEVLSLATELNDIINMSPNSHKTVVEMFKEVRDEVGKSKVPKDEQMPPHLIKVRTLIYSYLMRKEIPIELEGDIHFILEKVHKFLKKMMQISLSKNYLNTTLQVIELSQCFTQAMWYTDKDLLQLPHVDHKEYFQLKRLKVPSLEKLHSLSHEERMFVLLKIFDQEKADEIDRVCRMLPSLKVEFVSAGLGEDAQMYEGDIAHLNIVLNRVTEDSSPIETQEDLKEADGEKGDSDNEDDFDFEVMENRKSQGPIVEAFSARFPFPKLEGWLIILYDETNKRISGFEKVGDLVSSKGIDIKFQVASKGVSEYSVYIKSDSYRFVDHKLTFKLKAEARKVLDKELEIAEAEQQEEEEEEEEKEEESYWYYLGFGSFWELALNVFLLYIIALLGCDILESRGYISRNPFKTVDISGEGSYYDED